MLLISYFRLDKYGTFLLYLHLMIHRLKPWQIIPKKSLIILFFYIPIILPKVAHHLKSSIFNSEHNVYTVLSCMYI